MSVPHEVGKSSRQDILYIRGIPFKCPTSNSQESVAVSHSPAVASPTPEAPDCPSRALARCLSGEATPPVSEGSTAGMQAGLRRSRRSVRVFTGQGVPMRTLRELIIQSCADLGKNGSLVRFVMVEATPTLDRIRGMVEDWLDREGAHPKESDREGEPDKGLFGGAPHLAVVHGPTGVAGAAEACAMALARLEWAAAGAGIGACFAGEVLRAAAQDTALAAALTIPASHTAYGALLLGYSSFHVRDPESAGWTRIIWL
jgi:hypothetical protein